MIIVRRIFIPKIEDFLTSFFVDSRKYFSWMKQTLILVFTFLFLGLSAQDTLQLMHYNLLNYGNYFGDCTSSTNNVNTKNAHLRKITSYIQPDILTVNEISDDISYHQIILNQVLNTNEENKYRKAVSFNFADSYIVNQLYYNSEKLALYQQDVVMASYRDIDVYTLYYKAGDLAQTRDTLFLTCFVAHLKAGNDASDANARSGMVANAISYIRNHNLSGNMLFMGDLNLYTNSEQAYINLTYTYDGERYFYDPISREGNWHNNSSFKDVHTQSTHSGSTDCYSSGGLDDRFDFILASASVLDGNDGVQLVEGSYEALGNDGQHFNGSITDAPVNTSAPQEIIDALYGMSDHLPVLAKIKVDAALGTGEIPDNIVAIRFANPNNGKLRVGISLEEVDDLYISVYDMFGRLQFYKQIPKHQKFIHEEFNLQFLANGTYLFVAEDALGSRKSKKFLIKK